MSAFQVFSLAVREGFEPSVGVKAHAPLAGEYLQPLGHLTVTSRHNTNLVPTLQVTFSKISIFLINHIFFIRFAVFLGLLRLKMSKANKIILFHLLKISLKDIIAIIYVQYDAA